MPSQRKQMQSENKSKWKILICLLFPQTRLIVEALLPQYMLAIRIKFIFKGRNTRITFRGDYFPSSIVHVREDETMDREFTIFFH